MKKLLCVILIACIALGLSSCASKKEEENTAAFQPRLDTATACQITVAGSYNNFEALEAEFDRFNKIYPNVQLSYVKPDDYNNTLGTVLEGNDAPNIFFSFLWMMGNSKYDTAVSHMEDLSDPALNMGLDCIRPGLLTRDADSHVLSVPVFSTTYGMLVNDDLFKKEGLTVPTTWQELLQVCQAFKDKGYSSPLMGYSSAAYGSFMNALIYPAVLAEFSASSDTLALANKLDSAAGEALRPGLEAMMRLIGDGYIDLEACSAIGDNYTQVILRFFEGDVPMMICTGDTVSGTQKRESQSEAFTKTPFAYSFAPIPLSDEGGWFIDSPSVQFSVNKTCDNLDMTNEFMRFLVTSEELNQMAAIKRLVTPTTDLSFDTVYAPFGQVKEDRIISTAALGMADPVNAQIRLAAYHTGLGDITVDEAVAGFGSFEQ